MIRSTIIAVMTLMFSALLAGFVVFDKTSAQTATATPTPSVTTTPTTSMTMTPTPTGSVQGTSTVPSGAPATGHGE